MTQQNTGLRTTTHLAFGDLKNEARMVFDYLDVSENTCKDYKYRIGLFLEFLKKTPFNVNSYLEYKRYLTSRTDFAIPTKNKYIIAAKVFLKELNRRGSLPADITQNVKAFTQDKKHKKDGLSDDEMAVLAESLRELPETPHNARLKAIIALLALQGLRQIELVRLDVKDLDLVAKVAFVQGKGKDDKEPVNLNPETVNALSEYLKLARIGSGALFTSTSNNSLNRRLSTRALRGIVSTYLNNLGIDKVVHGFRHYFTTTLIKSYKGNLLEVSQYTRHKSLEMLVVYNDTIKRQADLPKFYSAFKGISF